MDNKITLLLLFIFVIPFTFSETIDVSPIDQGFGTTPDQLNQLTNSQIITELSLISATVNNLPARADMQNLINQEIEINKQLLSSQKSEIIVMIIIANLCTIGIVFAIIFYLKSRRLL